MDSAKSENLANDGLLTVKETACFLHVSVSKVYSLMERSELPYCKIGRSRRIPRRAVIKLAARNLVGREGPR